MDERLHKYFAGTLTDDEKQLLFDELENDSVLLDEFARLQNTLAVSGMARQDTDEAWSNRKLNDIIVKVRQHKLRRTTRSVLKYAAVAALLIATWLIASHNFTDNPPVEYTQVEIPKGQRVSITLPDGSQVWLSSRTKLKFSNQFNREERFVELDGEGFFSVEKSDIPFIVSAGDYNVEITGTEFNVFAYSQSDVFETNLIKGSVFIYKNNNKEKKLYLLPKEKAVAINGELHKQTSTFIRPDDLMNGVFSFEDSSFGEIINRLSVWYDIKFDIRNKEVKDYVFSGKFRQSDDINHIMQAIKETGKFDYRIINENTIEIY